MAVGIDKGKLLDQAQKYLQKGQIDRAIAEYQKIVEADPKDLRTRLKIGDLHLKIGGKKAAIDEYTKVAESYTSDGFNLQAIAVYKQLLKIDPSLQEIYIKLADLYKRQGLAADALAQYRIVINNYEKGGRIDEAIGALKEMASLDIENFSIRAKLADLYLKRGDKKEAVEVYSGIANSLKAKGRIDDVVILYEKLLSTDPSNTLALRELGEVYLRSGKKNDALSKLQAAVKGDPNDGKTLSLLAGTYMELGDLDNARLTYDHILRIDPSSLSAMRGISRILITGGDVEGGVRAVIPAVDKALEGKGYDNALTILFEFYRDGIKEPLLLDKMAGIYALKGEGEKAREIRDELADIYEARGDLARAEELRGEVEEVLEEVEEVGAEKPEVEERLIPPEEAPKGDASRYLTEADVYIKYGLKGKAVEILNSALNLFPDNRDIRSRLASLGVVLPELREVEEVSLEVVEEVKGGYPLSKVKDDLEEVDFYIQQGVYEEARDICNRILGSYPENAEALSRLKTIEAVQAQPPVAEPAEEKVAEEGFFDLAAELESEGAEALSVPGMRAAEQFGFEDIFSEFKKGLEAQLSKEDTETHYNLGIAYKEMGLLDDALREFEVASSDENKRFDCCNLIGICYMEKGVPRKAVEVFKKGLEMPGRGEDEYASVNYELGRAYELLGMTAEALAAYTEANRRSPGFRDVELKISSLGGGREVKKKRVSYV